MIQSVENLGEVAMAGGGLALDCTRFSVEELVRIAMAARGSGARLELSNCLGLRPLDDVLRIAKAGKGVVIFLS